MNILGFLATGPADGDFERFLGGVGVDMEEDLAFESLVALCRFVGRVMATRACGSCGGRVAAYADGIKRATIGFTSTVVISTKSNQSKATSTTANLFFL